MKKSVIGIVDTDQDARAILGDMHRIGFSHRDVSVLYPGQTGQRHVVYRHSSKAPEIALLGGGLGSALGAAAGLLASVGALILPGTQLLMSAGPTLAALSCGAAGAAVGCIAGALT